MITFDLRKKLQTRKHRPSTAYNLKPNFLLLKKMSFSHTSVVKSKSFSCHVS